MKKEYFVLFLLSFVFCSFTFWTEPGGLPGGEAISIQKVEPFAYFCLHHKGPFSEFPEMIGRLMEESRAQNVFPAGPLMGIYFNAPGEVEPEELEWEIGFPVTPQALVQPPLEKKEWNFDQVASCLHKGPYDKTGETIATMLEWMQANGYESAGPVLERYLDMNPQELKPEDLKTEIWIPCRKKA
jgi:effector-binding domain-containing protein